MISPNIIAQSNAPVRAALVAIRLLGRDPVTMGNLYSALAFRRRARDLKEKPQSKHWIKLGL